MKKSEIPVGKVETCKFEWDCGNRVRFCTGRSGQI